MNTRQTLELERQRLTERYQEQPEGRLFAPLADCHRKLGNLDQALQLCQRGLGRHPEYSSAYVILGKIQRDRGDGVAARAAFEKVLELDAQNLLALRQLAEIEEESGALEVAANWWRQVAALEIDPTYAEERLAQLTEGTATHSTDSTEQGPEPSPDPDQSGARDDSSEPVASADDVQDVAAPTGETPAAPSTAARPPRRAAVPTSEIATMTLAEIYAEQGFKNKALEIYRQIFGRNPEVATLAERIASLEAELAHPAASPQKLERRGDDADHRSGGPQDVRLDELEDALDHHAIVAASTESAAASGRAAESHTDSEPQVRPSSPLEASVVEKDEESEERARFNHFRSWLDRIRVDEN